MIASGRCVALLATVTAGLLLGAAPAALAQRAPGAASDAVAVAIDGAVREPAAIAPAGSGTGADVDADAALDSEEDGAPEVQTIGEGDQKIFLVDHHGTWSMHAENVMTDQIFRLWGEHGGPQVTTKSILDRPYTLSVHRLEPERIVERMLEDYSYTLHYDANARLERVRVYSLSATAMFKTPRLVESLGKWKEVETTP